MKNILYILSVFYILTSCKNNTLEGNGKIVKEVRKVNSFTSMECNGNINLFLKQGNPQSIEIQSDENIINHIITNVSGNKLKLYTEKKIRKSTQLNIYITVEDLTSIETKGNSIIQFETPFYTKNKITILSSGTSQIEKAALSAEKIDIQLSGSSKIRATLSCKYLALDSKGSSTAELKGITEKNVIKASGASSLNLGDLIGTQTSKISASGSSKIIVKKGASLDLNTSGGVSITTID